MKEENNKCMKCNFLVVGIILLVFAPMFYFGSIFNSQLLVIEDSAFFLSSQNEVAISSPYAAVTSDMTNDIASGYTHKTNVTYEIEYKWRIWSSSLSPIQIQHYFPRIQNHTHPSFSGVAPLQNGTLSRHEENSGDFTPSSSSFDPADVYNNSYDYYSVDMWQNDANDFTYNATYYLTLRETEWIIEESNIGEYNMADSVYIQYTQAENMLEVSDSDLIALSNNICSGKETILDKAKAIYDWITDSDNIMYELQSTEKSAKQAYVDGTGDCSEFSNLMVTLLRIQGIPSRKILGLTIVEESTDGGWKTIKTPTVGLTWDYYQRSRSGVLSAISLPGHAWIEYYIPNYGWVVCDPTWGWGGGNYFNRIDYSHLTWAVGENFGDGISPALPQSTTELGIMPSVWYPALSGSRISYDLDIMVKIIDNEIYYNNNLWIFIAVLIVVGAIAVVIYVALKARNKNPSINY